MTEDPEKYWDNIPHQKESTDPSEADPQPGEARNLNEEEREAENYTD